jgi:hypothetical protein
MEIVEKVNFHYEYQLAKRQLPESQILKINREYEYLALLWGDVEALANQQKYTHKYLALCEKINPALPKLKGSVEKFDKYFWGNISENFTKLNSKTTSFDVARELGLESIEKRFEDTREVRNYLSGQPSTTYILRTEFSVSGRGVFILRPGDDLENFMARFEKERGQQAVLVSPYLNRVKDFSVILSDNYEEIIYETMVDTQGHFRGVLIDNDQVNSLRAWMSEEDAEIFRAIFKRYKTMGANKIQIDSFFYDKGGELKIFHLAEVNARKTMGEMAYRLFKRSHSSQPYFSFVMSPERKKKKPHENLDRTLISPETSRHALYISEHENESAAYKSFE